MGLRFRKSIKIAPGVKVNLNKKSTSITFGTRGVHHTMNSKGRQTTSVGIPGTGISYSKTTTTKQKETTPKKINVLQSNTKSNQDQITLASPMEKQSVTTQRFFRFFCLIWGIIFCILGLLLLFVTPAGIVFIVLGIALFLNRKSIKKRLNNLHK